MEELSLLCLLKAVEAAYIGKEQAEAKAAISKMDSYIAENAKKQ